MPVSNQLKVVAYNLWSMNWFLCPVLHNKDKQFYLPDPPLLQVPSCCWTGPCSLFSPMIWQSQVLWHHQVQCRTHSSAVIVKTPGAVNCQSMGDERRALSARGVEDQVSKTAFYCPQDLNKHFILAMWGAGHCKRGSFFSLEMSFKVPSKVNFKLIGTQKASCTTTTPCIEIDQCS